MNKKRNGENKMKLFSIKSKDIVFFLLKVYNKGIEIDAQNGEEG